MIARILFALSVLILCSCSPLEEKEAKGPIDAYEVSLDRNLHAQSESVSGRGKIKFTSPLLSVNSKENYSIQFRFLNTKSSRLILHSHFSGFEYDDGVQIELYPEGGYIKLKISTPGYPAYDAIDLMSYDPGQEVSLKIEIHDGVSSGVRVIIWNDRLSYQGEILKTQERIFLGNHLFDSYEERISFFSHGRGMFWGVDLDQTSLSVAQRQLSYVQ